MFLFLLFHMVGKSHGPGGFLFQLIDSWTCSGCEHETSAGGEHPLLSAHLSRGAFTVCSCKEIDVHFFSTFHSQFQLPSLTISLSVGLIRSRYCSLQCVWGSAASSAVTSTLGGPLFYSVETSTCWNAARHISCQPALPELPGRRLSDREVCKKSPLVSQPSSLPPQL